MATQQLHSMDGPLGTGGGRVKSEQAKKAELMKEIRQLQTKIQNLEREKGTHIYNKRSDFRQEFASLEEIDQKSNAERKAEGVKLSQQLTKIRNLVKRFRRELQDVKPTPEFVEKLKVMMEEIESAINQLKEQQRLKYEELMKEERTVSLEVTALEKKFESWAQMTSAVPTKTAASKPVASARDITKDLPPEVAMFERFMQQTGGIRGGWDEYDQGTFLKFRNRHKGRATFLNELIPALPTKTVDEIKQHEDWYQEYLTLNDRKKEAIHKWRTHKESEKQEILEQSDETDSEEDEERKKKEQLQQKIEMEKYQRRTQLSAWKVQKEIEKAEEEERHLQVELVKIKKEEQEKHHQMEVKRQVLEYKHQKKEIEDLEDMEKAILKQEEEERCRQAARDLVKFRERDDKSLRAKLAKEKEKNMAEKERERKLECLKRQVVVNVKRDPSRLYQMTEGWKAREKENAQSTGSGGRVYQVQHRATPSWRQGLH